ncbi:MAG: 50S ribosomal protein L11 methyltransferase [Acidobacteria bacterium]|nr:50S ribosomal protein L11 methyltransferase [Acidobacteriota bacterium]
MWRVEIACAAGDEDVVLARLLPLELAAADTETPGLVKAWFASREDAEQAGGAIFEEEVQNWNQSWQAEWTAQPVGQRLWLAPPWDDAPAPQGRLKLAMHPGTLFGNGDHPTTLLCLEALERHVTPGCRVADIGCGSGLLQQAAKLLGASKAVGCDLDFAAAQAAPDAFQGSADAIASASIDVVIANIQLGVLERIAPELRRISRGKIVISGLLEDQRIDGATDIHAKDGWISLLLPASF